MKNLVKKLSGRVLKVNNEPVKIDYTCVYDNKAFYVSGSESCVYTFTFLNYLLKYGQAQTIEGLATIE